MKGHGAARNVSHRISVQNKPTRGNPANSTNPGNSLAQSSKARRKSNTSHIFDNPDESEEIIFFDEPSSSVSSDRKVSSPLPERIGIGDQPKLRQRREAARSPSKRTGSERTLCALGGHPKKNNVGKQNAVTKPSQFSPDEVELPYSESDLEKIPGGSDGDEDFEFSTDDESEEKEEPDLEDNEPQAQTQYDLILIASQFFSDIDRVASEQADNMEPSAAKAFMDHLRLIKIHTEVSPVPHHSKLSFVKLRASFEFLRDTAETLELAMPIAPNDLAPKTSKIAASLSKIFLGRPLSNRPPAGSEYKDCLRIPYQNKLHSYFMQVHEGSEETLFTPLQRSFMVRYELAHLRIPICEKFVGEFDVSEDEEEDGAGTHIVTLEWLRNNGLISGEFLLHDCSRKDLRAKPPKPEMSLRRWLANSAGNVWQASRRMPLDQLQQYLGPQMGFYFAWMEHYTRFLIAPAILSIFTLLIGIKGAIDGEEVQLFCDKNRSELIVCRPCPADHCEYTRMGEHCDGAKFSVLFDNSSSIIFSCFISLWAVVFLETWERKERNLAERWRTSEKLQRREDEIRPHFLSNVKTTRRNRITGKPEPWLPHKDKCLRLSVSLSWTLVALASMLSAMFGLILYRSTIRAILSDHDYRKIMGMSAEKFATTSASLINLVVINLSELIFKPIAKRLTIFELPRTSADYERSYTYKIYTFQFFNYYSVILYLALIQGIQILPPNQITTMLMEQCAPTGCMHILMIQLAMIMTVRQMIQNLIQIVVPMTVSKARGYFSRKQAATQCELDYSLVECPEPIAFNDYAEKIMQYGFITMFSPVFPISCLFALVNNIFKMRMDAAKYLHAYRRPVPHHASSIGSWKGILRRLTTFSVMVNVVLISFNSTGVQTAIYNAMCDLGSYNKSYAEFTFSQFLTKDYDGPNSSLSTDNWYFNIYAKERDDSLADKSVFWQGFITMLRRLEPDNEASQIVETCAYRGWFSPPGAPDEYTFTDLGTAIFLIQLVIVFVFQNCVLLATTFVRCYLSRSMVRASRKRQREDFINRELNLRSERDIEDNNESLDDLSHASKTDESASSEDEAKRCRKFCWTALSTKLETWLTTLAFDQ